MNKMKKALASMGVAVSLACGGSFVAAPAANAYTDGAMSYWQYNCQWDTRTLWTWRDYNWWEETFQFRHDGWVIATVQYYPC